MPAKNLQRTEGEGLYLHIYNQGIEKRSIFADEDDYRVFLGYLQDYLTTLKNPDDLRKTFQVKGRNFRGIPHQPKNYFNQVELVAYLLMPNHFHLIVRQVTKTSVEKFIRSLCTRYSMYFNKKYQRSGALFEGPYKSVPIKNELHLSHLTRYLHYIEGHSSSPEYLGTRKTSWVKPEAILSYLNKNRESYKSFAEKYEPDQKEEGLIDNLIFDSENHRFGRKSLTKEEETREEEIYPVPDLKPRSMMLEFIVASTAIFALLVALGIRNIKVSSAKTIQPSQTQEVLSEAEEVKPETSPESTSSAISNTTPKIIVTIKITDGSSSVNIRKEPTTNSQKIGQAEDGDTFEFISLDAGWYKISLADGSVGFISARYIGEQ